MTPLPSITIPAETLPAGVIFKDRPAQYWIEGDLVELRGAIWRIRSITHSRSSQRIAFTLYPCAGGRPEIISVLPRQWAQVARGY